MSTLVVSNIVPSGNSLTVDTAQTVFDSTDSIKIPVGTTANRPLTPSAGMIRYNSSTSQYEGYGPGGAWGSLGGLIDVDQDTYILAETSAGNDDDTLTMYAGGTNIASLGSSNFNVKIAADFDSTLNVDGALTAASLNIGTGALVAGSLDISGNADIDGTMEADAYTVNGTALNEYIADTVGAMVSSNTESGISVVYQDADNTLDFDVGDFSVTLTGAVTGSGTVTNLGNVSIATTATSDPTITLTGAVTGSATMTNLGDVSIATTATADPTLTLAGDASGSATFTNLGNATLTVTVANDSHTHDGRYYTESESDSRFVNSSGDSMSGNLTVTGDVTATNFNATSDASVKSDIMTIDSPLMTLSNLRGVNFDWKSTGTKSMGVVAQEVEKVLPYLVSTDSNGLKSVNYQAMVGLLIESVKDLQAQVAKLSK
jgi:cytoskeletal protein CcmA (bactofilin family)